MSALSNQTALDRAAKARAVLESPAYQEGWDVTRAMIIDRIEKCPMADTTKAEDLRKCLRLLNDVRANLEVAIKSGKLAEFRIQEEEARRKNPLIGLFR